MWECANIEPSIGMYFASSKRRERNDFLGRRLKDDSISFGRRMEFKFNTADRHAKKKMKIVKNAVVNKLVSHTILSDMVLPAYNNVIYI